MLRLNQRHRLICVDFFWDRCGGEATRDIFHLPFFTGRFLHGASLAFAKVN